MENLKYLVEKITDITTRIESNYPELYRFLDENPITIPSTKNPDLDKKILEGYLDDLNQLLQHHLETHKTNTI